MVDLEHIRNYVIGRPEGHSVFGSAREFDALPEAHREQILFLDPVASDYLWSFSADAHLMTGGLWAPFEGGNFREVSVFDDFRRNEESSQALKKWLYHRGIPFATPVFILAEGMSKQAVLTTWKMVVKYAPDLFVIWDTMIFDKTLNWCLFFYHEDKLFFGRGNVYDATDDEKRMEEWNERKRRFPQFKHPYL